jgi:osmoprotectant transport system permease protein
MLAAALINDLARAWERNEEAFPGQTLLFLSLTLRALGLALLFGIPLGLLLSRWPRLAARITDVLALVQTIPSIVLLGLLIPWLDIGQPAALFAAVVYSIFPIVMNTSVGISQVSPAIRDAARGMGMTAGQVLWHIELPLAFPVVLVGVRTAAVYASGMIVIGAYIGAGGLGEYIFNGISAGDSGLILLGTLPVLVLTLLLFWSLGGVAHLARKNSALGLSVGGGIIVVLSAYAGYGVIDRVFLSSRANVVIGGKDFVEGRILAEIVKQMLEAHTDLDVERKSNLGTGTILKTIQSGKIDLYVEYTGNLLTSKEALDMPVPADRSTITSLVGDEMRRRFGLVLLQPFGPDNTYALCVTQETARRYGLRRISDLERTPRLSVVIDLSFWTRPDGWQGMVKKYGLHFDRAPSQVSPDLLYKALEHGQADLVVGFATDWQIQSLELVVLEDDRGYFSHYHAAPLVREDVLRRHPQISTVLDRLAGQLDDTTMRGLNYEVAVERRTDAEVAHDFLKRKGLLP